MSTARKAAHAVVPIQKQRPLHAFRVPSVPAAPPACSENIFSSAPRSHPSCCHRGAELDVVAQTEARAAFQGVDGMTSLLQRGLPRCSCESPLTKLRACRGMHGRQRSLRSTFAPNLAKAKVLTDCRCNTSGFARARRSYRRGTGFASTARLTRPRPDGPIRMPG